MAVKKTLRRKSYRRKTYRRKTQRRKTYRKKRINTKRNKVRRKHGTYKKLKGGMLGSLRRKPATGAASDSYEHIKAKVEDATKPIDGIIWERGTGYPNNLHYKIPPTQKTEITGKLTSKKDSLRKAHEEADALDPETSDELYRLIGRIKSERRVNYIMLKLLDDYDLLVHPDYVRNMLRQRPLHPRDHSGDGILNYYARFSKTDVKARLIQGELPAVYGVTDQDASFVEVDWEHTPV